MIIVKVMKKLLGLVLGGLWLGLTLGAIGNIITPAHAQTVQPITPFVYTSSSSISTVNSSTVTVKGLGGAGTKCLQVNNSGTIQNASSSCGGGTGGSTSTYSFAAGNGISVTSTNAGNNTTTTYSNTGVTSFNGQTGTTTYTNNAGTSLSVTTSTTSSTYTLNLNNGSVQNCSAGQFANSITATGTISCAVTINTIAGISTSTITISGTANEITIATTTNSITLSTPQAIGTGSTPTFAGITINGNVTSTGAIGATNFIASVTSTASYFANLDTILYANTTSTGDYGAYLNGLCASSVANASGSIIVVPQGSYTFSTAIIQTGRCTFQGPGGGGTVWNWNGAQGTKMITMAFPATPHITGGGVVGITLNNLGSATVTNPTIAIDQNGGASNVKGGAHSLIRGDTITGFGYAIQNASGTYDTDIEDITMAGNGSCFVALPGNNSGESVHGNNWWCVDEANATTTNGIWFQNSSVETAFLSGITGDDTSLHMGCNDQVFIAGYDSENSNWASLGAYTPIQEDNCSTGDLVITGYQSTNDSHASSTSFISQFSLGGNASINGVLAQSNQGASSSQYLINGLDANSNIEIRNVVNVNNAYTLYGPAANGLNTIPTSTFTGTLYENGNTLPVIMTAPAQAGDIMINNYSPTATDLAIGTSTNSGAPLNIAGNSNSLAITVQSGNIGIATGWGINVISGSNSTGEFFTAQGIGIGTTTPQTTFVVNGTSSLPLITSQLLETNASGSIIGVPTSTYTTGGNTGAGAANQITVFTGSNTQTSYASGTYTTSTDLWKFSNGAFTGNFTIGTSTTHAASGTLYIAQVGTSTGIYGQMGAQVGNWIYFTDANGDLFSVDQFGSLRDTAAGIGGINSANGTVAGLIVSTGNAGSDALNTNGTTYLGSATATTTDTLQVNGLQGFTTSTLTLTSCGSSATSTVGSDNAGRITVGATATGCTLNFSPVWKQVPACTYNNQSMSITSALTYVVSTSTIVFSQATGLGGDILNYSCFGLPN